MAEPKHMQVMEWPYPINYDRENDVSTDVLVQLANETGGQYFPAPDSNQLASIYQVIRDILDGQYKIKYASSSSGLITVDLVVDTNGLQAEVSRQFQGCP